MPSLGRSLVGDAARFLPLSPQVFQVLLSLHDTPRHGYSIIQDIRLRTVDEMRLTASTLYDALARLVDQALIEEVAPPPPQAQREGPGEPTRHDTRRRYYALTTLGRDVAAAEARRLERLIAMARDKHLLGHR
jgi:DNA-binding PadR family transcriptional regulator